MEYDDDLDDYEDNVSAPQYLPVATMASNSNPRVALGLSQGKQAYETALDVSLNEAWALRDILEKPMRIHLQGTTKHTTAGRRDVDKLVKACFEDDLKRFLISYMLIRVMYGRVTSIPAVD